VDEFVSVTLIHLDQVVGNIFRTPDTATKRRHRAARSWRQPELTIITLV
jgi:hypothetical protein